MVQSAPTHQPAVLWSLGRANQVLTENSISNRSVSNLSQQACLLTANLQQCTSIQVSSPPFWANPNATNSLLSYSNTQKGASSWVSLPLSSRTCRWPWGFTLMLQKSPSNTSKELLLVPTPFPATHFPSVSTPSCTRDRASCPGFLVLAHHLSLRCFYRY